MKPATPRQRQLLEYIKQYMRENGYPPTVREIAEAFGIQSTNGVVVTLKALERKGLIARQPKTGRGIRVLEREPRGMPLYTLESLTK